MSLHVLGPKNDPCIDTHTHTQILANHCGMYSESTACNRIICNANFSSIPQQIGVVRSRRRRRQSEFILSRMGCMATKQTNQKYILWTFRGFLVIVIFYISIREPLCQFITFFVNLLHSLMCLTLGGLCLHINHLNRLCRVKVLPSPS